MSRLEAFQQGGQTYFESGQHGASSRDNTTTRTGAHLIHPRPRAHHFFYSWRRHGFQRKRTATREPAVLLACDQPKDRFYGFADRSKTQQINQSINTSELSTCLSAHASHLLPRRPRSPSQRTSKVSDTRASAEEARSSVRVRLLTRAIVSTDSRQYRATWPNHTVARLSDLTPESGREGNAAAAPALAVAR